MRMPRSILSALLALSLVPAAYAETPVAVAKALSQDMPVVLSPLQKNLVALKGSEQGLEVLAWVDRSDATYAAGDAITLYVKANRNAHITVLNVAPSGKVSVLFPNAAAPDNRVDAHRIVRIGGDTGYRLRAEGAGGSEVIKVIATDQPLELIRFGDSDPAGAFRVLRGDGTDVAKGIRDRLAERPDAAVAMRATTLRITPTHAAAR